MTPLKFRAWLPKQERMVEVQGFDFAPSTYPPGGKPFLWHEDVSRSPRMEDMEPPEPVYATDLSDAVVMQWTGLTDSKETEIYEGDIIRAKGIIWDEPAEIIWTKKYNGFGVSSRSSTDPFLPNTIRDIEIIGNCYANPDLL
jgi:uncharacterized phage protein (TIGR01671 family)